MYFRLSYNKHNIEISERVYPNERKTESRHPIYRSKLSAIWDATANGKPAFRVANEVPIEALYRIVDHLRSGKFQNGTLDDFAAPVSESTYPEHWPSREEPASLEDIIRLFDGKVLK